MSELAKIDESNSMRSKKHPTSEKAASYLIGQEGDLVSLEGSDGDGAEGSDLRLGVLGQQWDGLGQQGVLQAQQVHLDLGFLLGAVWALQQQLLHLHHSLHNNQPIRLCISHASLLTQSRTWKRCRLF